MWAPGKQSYPLRPVDRFTRSTGMTAAAASIPFDVNLGKNTDDADDTTTVYVEHRGITKNGPYPQHIFNIMGSSLHR